MTVENGRVGPLYKHIFPPKLAPNLSFVGLTYRVSPPSSHTHTHTHTFLFLILLINESRPILLLLRTQAIVMQMIDFQAKWVGHVLSGKARLPSAEEMEAEVQRHYQHMEEKGTPKYHTHCLDFEVTYI